MKTHLTTAHPQINVRDREQVRNVFQMRVCKSTPSPLTRQLGEALAIRRATSNGECVLNDKYEYTRCYIPVLTVEGATKPQRNEPRVDREDPRWNVEPERVLPLE